MSQLHLPTGRTHVMLGCGKAKRRELEDVDTHACGPVPIWRKWPLVDLYTGNLYLARLKYARQIGGTLWIVSGFHGFCLPDKVAGWYERDLNDEPSSYRNQWQAELSFCALNSTSPGDRVVVLASGHYAGKWTNVLETAGRIVEWPLEGMQMGEQLHWLKEAVA